MSGSDEQIRPPSRNLLGLLFRSLLHSIIKSIVLVFITIRGAIQQKVVRYGLAALLVAVAGGWYLLNSSIRSAQPSDSSSDVISVQASRMLPQPPEVERYLKAQANYDAQGMWNSIGQDMKAAMQQSSSSPVQALQAELDAAKQQGHRYRSATYIGGVPARDGMSFYFYVLTMEGPNGTVDVPYIYVLGSDGKIVSIQ